MNTKLLKESLAFGLVLAVVLILVTLALDKLQFDDQLDAWQKTALTGFAAGLAGFSAYTYLGVAKMVDSKE